jgi:acetyl esterase/lipase
MIIMKTRLQIFSLWVLCVLFSFNLTSQTVARGGTIHVEPKLSTAGNVIVERDIVYGSAWNDGSEKMQSLLLDSYQLEKGNQTSRPVIILVHGGGFGSGTKGFSAWQGNFYPDVATAFANAGYVAFSIDYRLWSNYPEDKFSIVLDNAVEDVISALKWVKANCSGYGIDTTKILIGGDSAGGGIAINASYRSENSGLFRACISLWGGLPPYGTSGKNPVNACPVTSTAPATCIIHGTIDEVVPYFISENLSTALTKVNVYNELHALDGLNHYPVNTSPNSGDYKVDLVNEIIEKMLTFSNKILETTSSVINRTSSGTMCAYPNPVCSGNLTLHFGSLIDCGTVTFTDLAGRELFRTAIVNEEMKNINLSGYIKGVYIIEVLNRGVSIKKKIVIG